MSRQTTKKRQQVRMGGPMGGMGTGEKAKDCQPEDFRRRDESNC